MAKKKGSSKRTAYPIKAGRKRAPNMTSYRDAEGKRHWQVSSSR
jgi:hypothetical protein